MKIMFLSDYYYPFIGGAEEVCRMEAEELAKRGHDVSVLTTLISSRQRVSEEVRGVKVFRMDLKGVQLKSRAPAGISWLLSSSTNYLYTPSARLLIKQIMKIKPEIIHVHNFMERIPPSIFRNLHALKVPIIVTLHDYRLICPRATFFCRANLPCRAPKNICEIFAKLNKILLKDRVRQFISPSKFLADCLKEKFGDVKVEVIPNPIQQKGIKTEKNLDEFRVLYVGRLVWYKGIHILLKTFRELKNGNARLLIAGSGPEFETVRRFSHLDPRITPLGFISEAEKQKLLRDASLTVIPSLWCEPFPMTALESFANGTPVAASKIGGLPEIVKDGYNGRLFKPGDTDHLKKILTELTNKEEELKKLQGGAIESALCYSIERHLEKLENIYNDLGMNHA